VLTFPFNTSSQPNGYHQLMAVAYEGSHVRTQKRVSQTVQIQNGLLSATFKTLFGGSNTLVGASLQFYVAANTGAIAKIELFSTGGSLGSVSNLSSAVFSVPGTNLDLGLHPFYAIVTAATGQQYRTQTEWIRLINTPEAPFKLSIMAPPPTVSWIATAGRIYNILSTTNLTSSFQLSASITASNSTAQWTDPSPQAPVRFYRVQTAN
jgi:hypothetical protein